MFARLQQTYLIHVFNVPFWKSSAKEINSLELTAESEPATHAATLH